MTLKLCKYLFYQRRSFLNPSMKNAKIILGFFLFFCCACMQKKEAISYPSVPGYNLANPVMIHLKTNLDEISGISYYPKDTSIFAVDDEEGILYKIFIRPEIEVKNWKFSSQGDYEDIVLHDSTFYALQSNGNLKSFRFSSKDSFRLEDCTVPLLGNNEFETAYYDFTSKKIILLCKDCEEDARKNISAYAFDPKDHTFSDQPFFVINADDIGNELGIENIKFRPSAAAVHPLTKDLYIISSSEKAIVVADHFGKVKNAYELDPRLFKQPEGITFTPSGDLIISNESAGLGAPNILIFTYKPLHNDKG